MNYCFIRQIAARFELDEESALENVLYVMANTSEHQYNQITTDPGLLILLLINVIFY